MRHLTPTDKLLVAANNALATLFGGNPPSQRPSPASDAGPVTLSDQQQKHVAGLMRINHCGEVCAQALYQGQALTARLPQVRDKMEQAASEENDHLAWCEQRLEALNDRPSVLNPLWYGLSFSIGALAGAVGDKWSLGFVAETEHQVVRHLEDHMQRLPAEDEASLAILRQMRDDELQHATLALQAGGAALPAPIKGLMQAMSKVMTSTVYYV